MVRINRALLAAFLCAGGPAATAGMCDPFGQTSPFSAAQWPTLSDATLESQRTVAAPNTPTQDVMQLPDATVVLLQRPAVATRAVEDAAAPDSLPSTSTAPQPELQMRLLMACLGFAFAVAGGVMLLLPRR